jgi:hypothetical protein
MGEAKALYRLVNYGAWVIDELFHGRTPGSGLVLQDAL